MVARRIGVIKFEMEEDCVRDYWIFCVDFGILIFYILKVLWDIRFVRMWI